MNIKSNRGFSLVQTLVGVGISTVVAVGIAAAVTNGMDGLSHVRNVNLAEDLNLVIGSILSDPDYCTKHFVDFQVPATLPGTVASNVELKELTNEGTLTGSILKKGSKYQNILEVESITLTVDSRVGVNRYLGNVNLSLKGVSGNRIHLRRSVPISVATDNSRKITFCSRNSEPNQGAEFGIWSSTCDDFSARGWPTKSACLRDGRWHLVYEVSKEGYVKRGSIENLVDLINDGVSIKAQYVIPHVTAASDLCTGLSVVDGVAACVIAVRPGVPDWQDKKASNGDSIVYFSDGWVLFKAPDTKIRSEQKWWAKY